MDRHKVGFALIVSAFVLLAGIGSYLGGNAPASTGSRGLCLVEVPQDSVSAFSNATTAGSFVQYSPGNSSFYPEGQCPSPVEESMYALISTIEVSPGFVAAENGSLYLFVGPGPLIGNLSSGEMEQYFVFDAYSGATFYPCGPHFIGHDVAGQIQVGLPVLANGTLDETNLMISPIPGGFLNVYHGCPPGRYYQGRVYRLASMPPTFALAEFTLQLVYEGAGYVQSFPNGSSIQYPGYSIALLVSGPNESEQVVFHWNPPCSPASLPQCSNSGIPPPPTPNVALFRGNLAMSWFSNETGTYLSASAY
jgi:hypothetical protein